jgi:hypothetical protein
MAGVALWADGRDKPLNRVRNSQTLDHSAIRSVMKYGDKKPPKMPAISAITTAIRDNPTDTGFPLRNYPNENMAPGQVNGQFFVNHRSSLPLERHTNLIPAGVGASRPWVLFARARSGALATHTGPLVRAYSERMLSYFNAGIMSCRI